MRTHSLLPVTALLSALAAACGGPTPIAEPNNAVANSETAAPNAPNTPTNTPARNLIIVIGDGMGPGQIALFESWARLAPTGIEYTGGEPTALSRLAARSDTLVSLTHPDGALVVDSACSATQLATGVPAAPEVVGLDAHGNDVLTILEAAQRSGRATGLVTDTRLTHATPAAFATHVPHRAHENEIAAQLVASGVDVMLSGGLRHFAPASVQGGDAGLQYTEGLFAASSRRDDERDLLAEARAAGYAVALDRAQLAEVEDGRVLGLFANSAMRDALTEHAEGAHSNEPTLSEMTTSAIRLLETNSEGFVLVVEAGQIDWAGHNNDPGWLLHEMVRLDEALTVVLDWAEGRDDTVVVLTADHETGGLGMSYSRADIPTWPALTGDGMRGLTHVSQFNFGSTAMLDAIWSQRASYASIFSDVEGGDTTGLADKIREVTGFELSEDAVVRLLAMEPNGWQVDDHEYLDEDEFPAIADFAAFYVYSDGMRSALLARALSPMLGVVWSNGTHTNIPVPVFVWSSTGWTSSLRGIVTHVEVGQMLFEAIGEEAARSSQN